MEAPGHLPTLAENEALVFFSTLGNAFPRLRALFEGRQPLGCGE
jgi:hypothetical protein